MFQYWSINGQEYTSNTVTLTQSITCSSPTTITAGWSGTAYYQYQPPGTISINPDTITIKEGYYTLTYTLSWSSAWTGTGTLTWHVYIPPTSSGSYIGSTPPPSNLVTWSASVTLPVATAAQGNGNLKATISFTCPAGWLYDISVKSSGSAQVQASGGSYTITVTVDASCLPKQIV